MATHCSRNILALAVVCVTLPGSIGTGAWRDRPPDALSFLGFWFEVDQHDRETLQQRGVVVRALPAGPRQIGVIAVTPLSIAPDTFVDRVRAAGGVKHADLVSGRFSDPPTLADLAPISLDDGDIHRLRRLCRPGDCRLNLADHEIAAVQRALAATGPSAAVEAQDAFRRVVLDRTVRYLTGGLKAVPEYHDRRHAVHPAAIFSEILQQSHYLKTHLPQVTAYLAGYPSAEPAGAESFLRWSKTMINGKAVVMVSHVSIFRPTAASGTPAVVVAGKQVYASRYMNGELTLTMLFAAGGGTHAYLVHVSRAELDELSGALGGLKRTLILGRIKDEATEGLARWRDRLERSR